MDEPKNVIRDELIKIMKVPLSSPNDEEVVKREINEQINQIEEILKTKRDTMGLEFKQMLLVNCHAASFEAYKLDLYQEVNSAVLRLTRPKISGESLNSMHPRLLNYFIDEGIIKIFDEPEKGRIILYCSPNRKIIHSGTVISCDKQDIRIASKPGLQYLFHHELWHIPYAESAVCSSPSYCSRLSLEKMTLLYQLYYGFIMNTYNQKCISSFLDSQREEKFFGLLFEHLKQHDFFKK